MIGAGIPATIAEGYGELYQAIASSGYTAGFDRQSNAYVGQISLEQFVENELKYALVAEPV